MNNIRTALIRLFQSTSINYIWNESCRSKNKIMLRLSKSPCVKFVFNYFLKRFLMFFCNFCELFLLLFILLYVLFQSAWIIIFIVAGFLGKQTWNFVANLLLNLGFTSFNLKKRYLIQFTRHIRLSSSGTARVKNLHRTAIHLQFTIRSRRIKHKRFCETSFVFIETTTHCFKYSSDNCLLSWKCW
jgi:hypothetical protein